MNQVIFRNITKGVRVAALTKDGKLDVRCAVAFGPKAGRNDAAALMMTVYIAGRIQGAGARGGVIRNADEPAWRTRVPLWTDPSEQKRQLDMAALLLTTKLGVDYELRLPTTVVKIKGA